MKKLIIKFFVFLLKALIGKRVVGALVKILQKLLLVLLKSRLKSVAMLLWAVIVILLWIVGY